MRYNSQRQSGCHINLAVTIGLAVTGHFAWKEVPAYLIAQFVGGIIGALAIVAVLGMDGVHLGGIGATSLGSSTGYIQGIVVEAIAAFVLMFVIMGIPVDSDAPGNWAGLVIGLTVGGLIMLTAGATGASFNPARTFGPYVINSLAGGSISWAQFPIYVIGPIIGAIGGAVAYKGLTTTKHKVVESDPHSIKG